jgi:hypothetical protein
MKIRLGFSISALLAILAIPAICFAQGVRYDNVATLDTGRPVQGATITVCASGSTGTPCTPTASIFSDSALSVPITQPGFQSGAQGNFFFYAACSKYDISFSGNGLTSRTMKDVQLGPCGTSAAKIPVSNVTLQGAGSGNSVNQICAQGVQSGVVGNGGSQVLFSCTILANTVATGKTLVVEIQFNHSVGTGSTTYTVSLNGQTIGAISNGATGQWFVHINVFASSLTTSNQSGFFVFGSSILGNANPSATSLNFAANQTLQISEAALANTDTVVPVGFFAFLAQ